MPTLRLRTVWMPLGIALSVLTIANFASAQMPAQKTGSKAKAEAVWAVLLDGTSMKGWNAIGNANWKVADGTVQADKGDGFLVSAASYKNFALRAEFWADEPANSGVFLRCTNPSMIDSNNAYEVNIYDTRPDQSGATGSIVDVAKPLMPMKAAGKWNTYEITADGTHLVVILNGVKTVDVMNSLHAEGRIGLQYKSGAIKFRKLEIRTL